MKIIVLIFLILLVGCSRKTPNSTDNNYHDSSPSTSEEGYETDVDGTQDNEGDNQVVGVPELPVQDDKVEEEPAVPDEDKVGQLIAEYQRELENVFLENDLYLLNGLDTQITYKSDNIVSVLFSGDMMYSPRLFRETLNIYVPTAERLSLGEIVVIDEGFISLVNEKLNDKLNEMGLDYAVVFPRGIESLLIDADNNYDSKSYFTSDEVRILFGVVHAIGDYIEVSIPRSSVIFRIQ